MIEKFVLDVRISTVFYDLIIIRKRLMKARDARDAATTP